MIFNTSMSLNIFNFWVSVYFSDLAVRGMIQGPQGLDRAINPTRPQAIFTLSGGKVNVMDLYVYLGVPLQAQGHLSMIQATRSRQRLGSILNQAVKLFVNGLAVQFSAVQA